MATPWWTDQQAQSPNVGGATPDYQNSASNTASAVAGISPQYIAVLQSLGYQGGMPTGPQDLQAIAQFIQQQGLTSKTSYNDTGGAGNQTSALFGANGQPVNGTQRTYASDVNEDAFLGAMLAAGAFGGATAAGVGVGATGAGADAAAGAAPTGFSMGGANGILLTPEQQAAYLAAAPGGVGAGTSAADAAAAAYPDFGAAASGAGGAGTSMTVIPGAASAGATAGLLDQLSNFATSKAGSSLIGAAAGLLGNSTGLNSSTQTQSKQIDPRLVPYVYGANGTGGLLGGANSLYQEQMSTGGLNANQTAGLNQQLDVLNSPTYAAGFNQERNLGSGLLNQGVAGNPFTQAPTAYGGAPMASAPQPPALPPQPATPGVMRPYGQPMSGIPNRIASGGLLGA